MSCWTHFSGKWLLKMMFVVYLKWHRARRCERGAKGGPDGGNSQTRSLLNLRGTLWKSAFYHCYATFMTFFQNETWRRWAKQTASLRLTIFPGTFELSTSSLFFTFLSRSWQVDPKSSFSYRMRISPLSTWDVALHFLTSKLESLPTLLLNVWY